MVDIIGGKWTTYRQMAEDAVDAAIKDKTLPEKPCQTTELKIHGHAPADMSHHLGYYGSDRPAIEALAQADAKAGSKIHPDHPFLYAEALWAVREEMAQTLEDVLARRIRLLFLDARAAAEVAEDVARYIAAELGKDENWVREQTEDFRKLCAQYHF